MSGALAVHHGRVLPSSPAMLAKVREAEARLLEQPQLPIETWHTLHGGMYARTIVIAAGTALTGAELAKATILILDGDATFNAGGADEEGARLQGRHVLAASAERKQLFFAHADTALTMIFATDAQTLEAAEQAMTPEFARLASRLPQAINHYQITGD